jgi:hypothetical protein
LYSIYVNDRSLVYFICLVEKSITSHYPSYKKTMFFKTKEAVFRTGGIHGTRFPIDWRNVVPVDFNEGTKRVEIAAGLPVRRSLSTTLSPWLPERFSIQAAGEAKNKKE